MFQAQTVNDGVQLFWQFSDAAGVTDSWFERSTSVVGPWVKVTGTPVVNNGINSIVDRGTEPDQTYTYRLMVQVAGKATPVSAIQGTSGAMVKEFALSRISPNPTTTVARIEYTVPSTARVRVSILDLQGRLVSSVVDATVQPGRYTTVWNGNGIGGRVAAGMYFVRFEGGGKTAVKRIALTR